MTRAGIFAAAALLAAPALSGEGEGRFAGQSDHVTEGGVSVVRTGAGWEIRLAGDFELDGAPDPGIGFGIGGRFAGETDFAALVSESGAQVYPVPAEIDPEAFDTVILWCRRFSVPLGHARNDRRRATLTARAAGRTARAPPPRRRGAG